MTERQSPPSPDDPTRREPRPTGPAPQGPTLEDLDARLRKARGAESSGGDRAAAGSPAGLGGAGAMLRIGIEMVSAVAVGVGIGWLLDLWLGTKPWLMVVFFFMGAAAGMLGVYRATGRLAYGVDAVKSTEAASRDAAGAAKGKQGAANSARNDRE